jgi:DeoR family transcriptional regulator, aga operon transcriptional repressor
VKRAMIDASQRCVVMADSSKIGTRTLASVCAIDDVDVIVTDSDVRDTDVDWLKERGVDVIVA